MRPARTVVFVVCWLRSCEKAFAKNNFPPKQKIGARSVQLILLCGIKRVSAQKKNIVRKNQSKTSQGGGQFEMCKLVNIQIMKDKME